ncbi:hypothetical protein NBRGN_074_00380 [Nocardia brasiliensis NBRC 14402]|nr:hypothetical protein [Nocardia brasiliensis]GAJ84487.1 hypothetical protein NBRGN_074_00380 [Nocardia brasiliensis NBRC 14402]
MAYTSSRNATLSADAVGDRPGRLTVSLVSGDVQDEFSASTTLLDAPVRLGGLVERENFFHLDVHLAIIDQCGDLGQRVPIGFDEEWLGPHAARGGTFPQVR